MGTRWGDVTAEEILPTISGELVAGSAKTPFSGLSTDSRGIFPGALFWVLRGERYDAHDFINNALEEGAAGVVLEEPSRASIPKDRNPVVIRVPDTLKALGDLAQWWRRIHGIPVVAITGSVGKTTTKEMTARILELGGSTLKNEGNFNNLVGLPLTLLSMAEGHRRAVLELGMNHPGEIARLTDIADPDVGLITNVARVHIEGLGSIEGVARAKVELVEKISSRAVVLLNGDDQRLMKAALPFKKNIRTFGLEKDRDFRATGIRNFGREGMAFELHYAGGVLPLNLRVPGLQQVSNALAACAAALCLHEDPENLIRGLDAFRGIKGRFAFVHLHKGITLVDDTYNANPTSLKAALLTLRDMAGGQGRMIAGLGEMLELGEETQLAHREAGEVAVEMGVDYLVALGEHAWDMVRGAMDRGLPPNRAEMVGSHEAMAAKLIDIMKEGDLILLKGSRGIGLDKVVDLLKAQYS